MAVSQKKFEKKLLSWAARTKLSLCYLCKYGKWFKFDMIDKPLLYCSRKTLNKFVEHYEYKPLNVYHVKSCKKFRRKNY